MSSKSSKAWPAPAKLNLFLHITGRRADGYHLLQTVFQFINHCDWLYFTPRDDGVIRRLSELPGVAPEHDLTVRAARLLQGYAPPACGVDIRLDKRLPMGGGLGGGSSDAATTLVALNQLWGLHLPTEQLAALGLQLGADVPVFIHGRAAWAEGVGEIMTPITTLPEPWYVVIVPPCQVSTHEIFSAPELTRDAPTLTIEGFLSPGRMPKCGERSLPVSLPPATLVLPCTSQDAQEPPAICLGSSQWEGWGGSNVCEPVVGQRYPPVAAALAWLRKQPGAVGTRMTGTGACVFAAFADESSARQVLQRLRRGYAEDAVEGMQGFVAKGMNRSPLY